MKKLFSVVILFLASSTLIALAQTYPSRSITVIMGLPAGVGTDAIGRRSSSI